MANYTTADIKALRERTGAGMLDVKKALDEAEGDADKAVEIIRAKGLKGIAKREGRSAVNGLVAIEVADAGAGQRGTMVEVNSETDFVAKTPNFGEMAAKLLAAAAGQDSEDPDTVLACQVDGGTALDTLNEAQAVLGEKLQLRRVAILKGEVVSHYLHKTDPDLPPQVGVMLATDAAGAKVAHDIAMHIAAMSPAYLTREDVPEDIVASERRIAEELSRSEGKPEKVIPKIVEGRVNGFFKDNCLVDQAFARDPHKTVGQVMKEAGGTITGFVRYRVGA
ncbi:MAG: translation elongation factor Ts [Bifidobacteriaceae bacterium]|jgi:elongation factor Ts|nr:translation elongation factor Ts [Bifidobacteriaceae bacterium]